MASEVLTYGDLPASGSASDMTCDNDACDQWHVLYSACRSDYFMHPDEVPVVCHQCNGPMFLAREIRTVVIQIERDRR